MHVRAPQARGYLGECALLRSSERAVPRGSGLAATPVRVGHIPMGMLLMPAHRQGRGTSNHTRGRGLTQLRSREGYRQRCHVPAGANAGLPDVPYYSQR